MPRAGAEVPCTRDRLTRCHKTWLLSGLLAIALQPCWPVHAAVSRPAYGARSPLTAPLSWSGAWQGELTVLRQQGRDCAALPPPPYVRHLRVSAELDASLSGQLFFSGETSGLQASGQGGQFQLRSVPGPDVSAGALDLSMEQGKLQGRWQESAPADAPGCHWLEALIKLTPQLDSGRTARRTAEVFWLGQHVQSVASEHMLMQWVQLIQLGVELADAGVRDLALARFVQEQADVARLMRLPGQTLDLSILAVRLHRLISDEYPEATAEALSRLAAVYRSRRQRPEAETLYLEALQLLDRSDPQHRAMASAVHNSLGSLYLRQRRLIDAAQSFRQALEMDRLRLAPSSELAVSMNNLAHALGEQGLHEAALGLYEQALALLDHGDAGQRDLRELINGNARRLRGESAHIPLHTKVTGHPGANHMDDEVGKRGTDVAVAGRREAEQAGSSK